MGLFDLFSKKSPSFPVREITWMYKTYKWKGCIELSAEHPNAVLVSWFPDTAKEYIQFASKHNGTIPEVKDARHLVTSGFENKTIIFLEHYPILSKEQNLLQELKAEKIIVLNALDEPLLLSAGGVKIVSLMKTLGMQDEEKIEHALIGKSIRNFQEKLEKKISFESTTSSAEAWFERNHPSKE